MGRSIQVSKPTMKTIRVALLTFFALIDLSWQARPPSQSLYGPPSSPHRPHLSPSSPHRPHPSPPSSPPGHHQPSCKQVPKEVCRQVPRQTYESVTRQLCRDVPDQVCTQAQEKKCSNQKICSIHYRKECEDAKDIKKQCTQVQDEECYSTAKLQCVQLPKNVQETVHEEQCSTEYDTECSVRS